MEDIELRLVVKRIARLEARVRELEDRARVDSTEDPEPIKTNKERRIV